MMPTSATRVPYRSAPLTAYGNDVLHWVRHVATYTNGKPMPAPKEIVQRALAAYAVHLEDIMRRGDREALKREADEVQPRKRFAGMQPMPEQRMPLKCLQAIPIRPFREIREEFLESLRLPPGLPPMPGEDPENPCKLRKESDE